MGFFDTIKKGAEIAKKGAGMVDEANKRVAQKASDSELKELLSKNPNNKYAREELQRRGL